MFRLSALNPQKKMTWKISKFVIYYEHITPFVCYKLIRDKSYRFLGVTTFNWLETAISLKHGFLTNLVKDA